MSIEIKDLTYIYNKNGPYEKTALDNISLTVADGEFVGIIGHTGSGKSTLIQHFNGIMKPTAGTVLVDGEDIFKKGVSLKNIRKKVGLVFQYPEYQLFEETVYKDVAYGLKNYGVPHGKHGELVKNAIKSVGLSEDVLDKSPFELSGGQKRRVAIAGVIVMQPKILVLDEPAAGLDPFGRQQILEEIKRLHDEQNITVILVSHSMEDIALYADRIVVLDKGRIYMDGSPAEVFSNQDKLLDAGLDIPEILKILNELKNREFCIPDDIFSVKDAAMAIYKSLKEGKNA